MRKLYIADDETAIRDGLKLMLDWNSLGYFICGESGNGTDTFKDILELSPDLVLLDIRMPGMTGLDVIASSKQRGFGGHFIILSGYSDFKYAQTAMKYNVRHYLTKPIDEDELTQAVIEVNDILVEVEAAQSRDSFLRTKSRREIILDILRNRYDTGMLPLEELELNADSYQIVAYENFNIEAAAMKYRFSELFSAIEDSLKPSVYEAFEYDKHNILLLIGNSAIERFKRFLSHYDSSFEKDSPLDSLFIAYGCIVNNISELNSSYTQACELLRRRFFCIQGQHILSYDDLPSRDISDTSSQGHALRTLQNSLIPTYCSSIVNYLQTFTRRKLAEEMYSLEEYLYSVDADITAVKVFLTDLYLQIKNNICRSYDAIDLPFESNADIISFINTRNYLYEILIYFSEQFEKIMNSLGNSSRDSVLDDIIYYIEHNYQANLKLEMIASLFGYNSSYLGKIFNKTIGESFNTYVDRVRIKHALELLSDSQLKVYEISSRVGYSNVDYFHKKFRKYVGESPAEYRKRLGKEVNE